MYSFSVHSLPLDMELRHPGQDLMFTTLPTIKFIYFKFIVPGVLAFYLTQLFPSKVTSVTEQNQHFHRRNVSKFCPILLMADAETLVQVIVSSCNTQQNQQLATTACLITAARILTRTTKFNLITPVQISLH